MAALSKRLLIIFAIVLSLLILSVAAQDEPEPEPEPEPPVQSPSPSPSPSASPSPSFNPDVPTATSSAPVVPTGPPTPSPVFSTSADCVACKPDYGIISACVQRIPKTANLTVITQVLPFYNCICPGNMIDALQRCSTCLRSTGQLNFLNPGLYNVTNQEVKAMKDVCVTTANGTQTPNGSSGGHWERLMASASWGAVLSVVVIVVSLGGM